MFRVSDRKKKMRRTAVAMVVLLSGVLLAARAGHMGFWNLFSAAEDTASQLSVVHIRSYRIPAAWSRETLCGLNC